MHPIKLVLLLSVLLGSSCKPELKVTGLYTVKGVIRDSCRHTPFRQPTEVWLDDERYKAFTTTTDENGNFRFDLVPYYENGYRRLTISADVGTWTYSFLGADKPGGVVEVEGGAAYQIRSTVKFQLHSFHLSDTLFIGVSVGKPLEFFYPIPASGLVIWHYEKQRVAFGGTQLKRSDLYWAFGRRAYNTEVTTRQQNVFQTKETFCDNEDTVFVNIN